MSFGSFLSSDDDVMSEINMTPLVDVMLVLLIIFMVTMPALTHSVKLSLPQTSSKAANLGPSHVSVSILPNGGVLWEKTAVTAAQLPAKFQSIARRMPQPEVHVYADGKTPYEQVAQVMAAAQTAGLSKIGLMTQPKKQN